MKHFACFLGRSPDTATPEDLRAYQPKMTEDGVSASTFNVRIISLRFFFGVKEYRRNLRRFILPALGQLTVTSITRADVAKFHHDLRHIPYQANRCLEVVSKMFVLAEMWGLRPDGSNPRKHIRKYPEEKR